MFGSPDFDHVLGLMKDDDGKNVYMVIISVS